MKNKKKNIKLVLLLLLLCITLGYAVLRTGLNINGIATIPSVSWEVYFSNYQKSDTTNIEPSLEPSIPVDEKPTSISYSVVLSEPGDLYEFTVDVVNGGTIDAMIEDINNTLEIDGEPAAIPDYINYIVTYSDGSIIVPNEPLLAGDKETIRVRVGLKVDITPEQLSEASGKSFSFQTTIDYKQSDKTTSLKGFKYDNNLITFDYLKDNKTNYENSDWEAHIGGIEVTQIEHNNDYDSYDVVILIKYIHKTTNDFDYQVDIDIRSFVSIENVEGSEFIVVGECAYNPDSFILTTDNLPIANDKFTLDGKSLSKIVYDVVNDDNEINKIYNYLYNLAIDEYYKYDYSYWSLEEYLDGELSDISDIAKNPSLYSESEKKEFAIDYIRKRFSNIVQNDFCPSLRDYFENKTPEQIREMAND